MLFLRFPKTHFAIEYFQKPHTHVITWTKNKKKSLVDRAIRFLMIQRFCLHRKRQKPNWSFIRQCGKSSSPTLSAAQVIQTLKVCSQPTHEIWAQQTEIKIQDLLILLFCRREQYWMWTRSSKSSHNYSNCVQNKAIQNDKICWWQSHLSYSENLCFSSSSLSSEEKVDVA